MQFQHGTYSKAANGSLTLSPIAVDGRQLLSNPCSYDSAIYTRYNQTELFLVRLSGPTSIHPSRFPFPSTPRGGPVTNAKVFYRDTKSAKTSTTTSNASTSSSSTARP